VEPRARDFEVRREVVDRAVVARRSSQGILVGSQLDHHGSAVEPRGVEQIGDGAGIGHLGFAHPDPGAGRPGLGHRKVREHDDAPAELGWSGVRHPPNIAMGCLHPARAVDDPGHLGTTR
jgi:hypothetical protein